MDLYLQHCLNSSEVKQEHCPSQPCADNQSGRNLAPADQLEFRSDHFESDECMDIWNKYPQELSS